MRARCSKWLLRTRNQSAFHSPRFLTSTGTGVGSSQIVAHTRARARTGASCEQRGLLDVLEGFAIAEAAEALSIPPRVPLHLGGIGPRVLPQRPSDRFAQKKFLRIHRGLNAGVE